MNVELIPLISFVLVTTFTPGPNNIASASLGVAHGYRKTVDFLFGISAGFFVVMIACAYLSSTLLTFFPSAEKILRWLGAGYILWLAIGLLHSGHSAPESDNTAVAFTKGFVLQMFNPKVVIYGLTLYSTFLAPLSNRFGALLLSALLFALTAFLATSTWALFGAAIREKLAQPFFRKILSVFLSMLLIYTAVDLSGIFG